MIIKKYHYPTVLSIAGSDSGGGAGIQADIKTISALGCYATTAITAVTVQDTKGVKDIYSIPVAVVVDQIAIVMEDIKPIAIKIGMLDRAELVHALVDELEKYPHVPIVLDPVLVATSGHKLTTDDTLAALKERLCPISTVMTPNLDEAAIFYGKQISTKEEMKHAAKELMKYGGASVLIKGGHLYGNELFNVLETTTDGQFVFPSKAIATHNTHGSGCSLSSAIASYLALGNSIPRSVEMACDYVHQAIATGADVKTGGGNGPINHFYAPKTLEKHELDNA